MDFSDLINQAKSRRLKSSVTLLWKQKITHTSINICS